MTHRASPHDGIPSCETQNIMSRRLVSLMDFSKLVAAFDRHGVTFVSVTRSRQRPLKQRQKDRDRGLSTI
jgi:hypothetical protein